MKTIRNLFWGGAGLALLIYLIVGFVRSFGSSHGPPLIITLLQIPICFVVGYWLVVGAWRRTNWMQQRHARSEAEPLESSEPH